MQIDSWKGRAFPATMEDVLEQRLAGREPSYKAWDTAVHIGDLAAMSGAVMGEEDCTHTPVDLRVLPLNSRKRILEVRAHCSYDHLLLMITNMSGSGSLVMLSSMIFTEH